MKTLRSLLLPVLIIVGSANLAGAAPLQLETDFQKRLQNQLHDSLQLQAPKAPIQSQPPVKMKPPSDPIAQGLLCPNIETQATYRELLLQAKTATIMGGARETQGRELMSHLSEARRVAVGSSTVFALALALIGALMARSILPKAGPLRLFAMLAFAHVYFFIGVAGVRLISTDLSSTLDRFRREVGVETVTNPVGLAAVRDIRMLDGEIRNFLNWKKLQINRVAEVYKKSESRLPQSRWWTLGWDEVRLVEVEVAAAEALLARFQEHKAGTTYYLQSLADVCRQASSI